MTKWSDETIPGAPFLYAQYLHKSPNNVKMEEKQSACIHCTKNGI